MFITRWYRNLTDDGHALVIERQDAELARLRDQNERLLAELLSRPLAPAIYAGDVEQPPSVDQADTIVTTERKTRAGRAK